MTDNYIIAVEIGTGAVKAAAAIAEDRSATLLALESETLNRSVRYGRVQNVEEVSNALCAAIDNLAQNPEVAPRNIVGVYAGVGGRSLHSLRVSAHLTLPEEQEITLDIIERLKDTAIAEVPAHLSLLRVIPLRFTVDGVPTQRPKGTYGTRLTGDFTVIVCNPNNTRQLERVISERLGLDICGWVVRPLAIARTVLTPEDAQPGCMLVDMGAETTTVTIVKDGNVQYINTIPVGSDHITGDIASGLGITRQMAETMKMRQGTAIPDLNPDDTAEQVELNHYVSARAEEIVDNVIAHIEYAGFAADDLHAGIILTGCGARLRSMGSLLEQRSRLKVRQASLPSWMHVAITDINPLDNIDIISCLADGMRQQASRNDNPCVEMPAPEPVAKTAPATVEPEPELDVKFEIKAETVKPTPANGQEFDIDEKTPAAPKREVNDEDLLVDDDEAERRQAKRKAEAEQKAREAEEKARRKAEKEARRQAGKEEREKAATAIADDLEEQEYEETYDDEKPRNKRFSAWGGYIRRTVDLFFKENEGTELDDDE